jgi:hypothetical protein
VVAAAAGQPTRRFGVVGLAGCFVLFGLDPAKCERDSASSLLKRESAAHKLSGGFEMVQDGSDDGLAQFADHNHVQLAEM